jgi:hypothetical protein
VSARAWQLLLLLPGPPLTLLYLQLVRAEQVQPRFTPVIMLGLLPVASIAVAGIAVRPQRAWLLLLALAEILAAVLAAALVGFAIAAQSG